MCVCVCEYVLQQLLQNGLRVHWKLDVDKDDILLSRRLPAAKAHNNDCAVTVDGLSRCVTAGAFVCDRCALKRDILYGHRDPLPTPEDDESALRIVSRAPANATLSNERFETANGPLQLKWASAIKGNESMFEILYYFMFSSNKTIST